MDLQLVRVLVVMDSEPLGVVAVDMEMRVEGEEFLPQQMLDKPMEQQMLMILIWDQEVEDLIVLPRLQEEEVLLRQAW
jgi:hypothetical protein